ncbi:hypothetical protein [Aeromonas dhakensis]|uniref:hypothetical protein n=1 Tax=Aeromonas dhakensis TaxID=196024 RepID=UPI001177C2B2|nr:hypothetical protein [Aeromonas dhakensis]
MKHIHPGVLNFIALDVISNGHLFDKHFLSVSVDLVTFVMSSRGTAPSSPSSVATNTAFIIKIISLFSYGCDFVAGHLPVLV